MGRHSPGRPTCAPRLRATSLPHVRRMGAGRRLTHHEAISCFMRTQAGRKFGGRIIRRTSMGRDVARVSRERSSIVEAAAAAEMNGSRKGPSNTVAG